MIEKDAKKYVKAEVTRKSKVKGVKLNFEEDGGGGMIETNPPKKRRSLKIKK